MYPALHLTAISVAVPRHAASAGLALGNPATLTFTRGGCSRTRLAHWTPECSVRAQHNHQCRAHQAAGCGKVTSTGPGCGRPSASSALSTSHYRPASSWPRRRRLVARHHCTRRTMPNAFKRVHAGSPRSAAADPPRSPGPSRPSMRRCRRACAMMCLALTAVAAPAAALDAVAALSPTPVPEHVVITP